MRAVANTMQCADELEAAKKAKESIEGEITVLPANSQ